MEYASFEQKHYTMAKNARALSFIALVTSLLQLPILPFIFGGLAILFAALSKGNTEDYSISAKLAIVIGILSILINIFFISFSFYKTLTNPVELANLNNMCMQFYGMTWTDMLNDFKNSLIK